MAEAVDTTLIVEDVVYALTGSRDGGGNLADQMSRATTEFDKKTADAFGRALLESLTEDPANLRQLEALVILGLAHPEVLRKHRISLSVEGRRLAVLLERADQVDRACVLLELLADRLPDEKTIDYELAGVMRRSGNSEELLQRYLDRAQECAECGRPSDAIQWLQEILLIDRSRRDVARMIRDLRFQEAELKRKRRRRNRMLVVLVAFSGVLTFLGVREQNILHEFAAVPMAVPGDVLSVEERLAGVSALIEKHQVWMRMGQALAEQAQLEKQAGQLRLRRQQEHEEAVLARKQRLEAAESARLRGLRSVERGDYVKALADFRWAAELSTPEWKHTERVLADVQALQEYIENQEQDSDPAPEDADAEDADAEDARAEDSDEESNG